MPVPDPDLGEVDPDVAAALTSYAADPEALPAALAAVAGTRLLLAMVEVPADTFPETGHDHGDDQADHEQADHEAAGAGHGHGHGHEAATTAMAAVSIQRPDGRRGMLAFTGVEPLRRWDPAARPLPVTAREAAQTALGDGADALLVDLAGPVRLVLEGEDLAAVAGGWTLGRVGERSGWIRPTPE